MYWYKQIRHEFHLKIYRYNFSYSFWSCPIILLNTCTNKIFDIQKNKTETLLHFHSIIKRFQGTVKMLICKPTTNISIILAFKCPSWRAKKERILFHYVKQRENPKKCVGVLIFYFPLNKKNHLKFPSKSIKHF